MKWYSYALCFLLILVGIYSGVILWQKVNAESYINGSINLTNDLYFESFVYDNSLFSESIVFLDNDIANDNNFETHNYSWQSSNLPAVLDFNGVASKYQVEVNGYRLFNETISAGGVYAQLKIDFYDTENNLICASYYDLSIKFLSNRTELTIKTVGNKNVDFLEQYFIDNGLRISVKELRNV